MAGHQALVLLFVALCAVAAQGHAIHRRQMIQRSPHGGVIINPTLPEDPLDPHDPYVHPKTLAWGERRQLAFAIDPNVTITLSSTNYTTNPQTITVTWSGVTQPNGNDLIGVWSPGDADPSNAPPLFWYNANSSTYLTTGSGRQNFSLINTRNNYRFRLVKGSPLTPFPDPTVIAESALVINSIPNLPQQVHLGIHNDSASIIVQWVSNTSDPTPVRYGTATGAYTGSALSNTTKYTREMMCGDPARSSSAFTDPGFTHTAVIPASDIGNNQRIYYQVGSPAQGGLSKEFSFLSPPRPEGPVKFVAFHDLGSLAMVLFNNTCICNTTAVSAVNTTTNTTSTGARCTLENDTWTCCTGFCPIPPGTPAGQVWYYNMFQYTPNSIKLAPVLARVERDAHLGILNGDLAYAHGYTDNWDWFGSQFEDAFASWPLATGSGNHERNWPGTGDNMQNLSRDSGGECNVAYTHRYYNPGPGDLLDPFSSYYSFTMGPVFFIILDGEMDVAQGSPQGDWVRRTIANINYTRTPWVVASLHRMMLWPSVDSRPVQGDIAYSRTLLAGLEDVFYGKVHFVTQGHQHAYGRTCPVYNYTCLVPPSRSFIKNSPAPIYVLAGNGGAGFTTAFPQVMPNYVSFAAQFINGYIRFNADMNSITMEAISTDPLIWFNGARNNTLGTTPGASTQSPGVVFDTVTLTR